MSSRLDSQAFTAVKSRRSRDRRLRLTAGAQCEGVQNCADKASIVALHIVRVCKENL